MIQCILDGFEVGFLILQHEVQKVEDVGGDSFGELHVPLVVLLHPESVPAAEQEEPQEEVLEAFHGLLEELVVLGVECALNAQADEYAYDFPCGYEFFVVLVGDAHEEVPDGVVVGLELFEFGLDEVDEPVFVHLTVLVGVLEVEVCIDYFIDLAEI
jgi:hypothetical protein